MSAQIWKIKDIELVSKKIYVTRAVDGNPPMFSGGSGNITNEIRSRMKTILEDRSYWIDYSDNIKKVLLKLSKENLRYEKFQWTEENDKIGLRTFQSTKINRTLQLLLNMLGKGENYKLDDRTTFISGCNIKEDINRVIERSFNEEEIFRYLKDSPQIVELYLSSNKYRNLLPDDLKIKYIIKNKLGLEGTKAYLGIL